MSTNYQLLISKALRLCFVIILLSSFCTLRAASSSYMIDLSVSTLGLPDSIEMNLVSANGVSCEFIYFKDQKPSRVIMHLHGGAYINPLDYRSEMFRAMAVEYVERCNVAVLNVDYRVAPKDPFPAALEDACLAYLWLLSNGYEPNDIIVAGDSAGGGLAIALSFYLRDNNIPLPKGIITMSAWTDLKFQNLSKAYVGNNDPKDPYISPIYGDFKGLPPMLMQYSNNEIIEKDSILASAIAQSAGVKVTLKGYNGNLHDFQVAFPKRPESIKAWEDIEDFVKSLFF